MNKEKQKKIYIPPEIECYRFDCADVITASGDPRPYSQDEGDVILYVEP